MTRSVCGRRIRWLFFYVHKHKYAKAFSIWKLTKNTINFFLMRMCSHTKKYSFNVRCDVTIDLVYVKNVNVNVKVYFSHGVKMSCSMTNNYNTQCIHTSKQKCSILSFDHMENVFNTKPWKKIIFDRNGRHFWINY